MLTIKNDHEIAIVTRNLNLTYFELKKTVDHLVHKFNKQKIQPGSVVWISAHNCIETILVYLACWSYGLSVIPVDHQTTEVDIQKLNVQLSPKIIFAFNGDRWLSYLQGAPYTDMKSFCENEDFVMTNQAQSTRILKDTSLVQMTSGTTGEQKKISLSISAIVERAKSLQQSLKLDKDTKTLCVVPVSHSHGIDCLILPTLFGGGTVYLYDVQTAYPYRILKWIEEYKITFFSHVPQMYHQFNILAETTQTKKYDLSSLKYAFCGSAALSEETAIGFKRNYGVDLQQGYGVAEIGVICINNDFEQRLNYSTIGRPLSNIEYIILDDGELAVRSPALFNGYIDAESETQEKFFAGYLLTGDIIQIDSNGCFYVVGRKNDMININGQKMYPREIEDLIYDRPEISCAAVLKYLDENKNEKPIVFLESKMTDPIEQQKIENELIKVFIKNLSEYKIPKKFIWLKEFPKSPLGKVLKTKLQGFL